MTKDNIVAALNDAVSMASYYATDFREANTYAEYTCNKEQIDENFRIVNDAKEALAELRKYLYDRR
jgi:hypothetical protein